MAVVIVSTGETTFTLDGIQHAKNFIGLVLGDKVTIVNIYDSRIVLVKPTVFSDFTVGGGSFGSAALLQVALLPVIYKFVGSDFYNPTNSNDGNIDWDGKDITASGDLTADMNVFANLDVTALVKVNAGRLVVGTGNDEINSKNPGVFFNVRNGDGTTDNFKNFEVRDGKGANVMVIVGSTKDTVYSGNVTATGFTPFTGIHIAKSTENLQIGELIQLISEGRLSEKQPDWHAYYCEGTSKGVYGVVYDTRVVEVMEIKEGTEGKEQLGTGEFYVEHLIAALGDAVIQVDCPCESGDILIPSSQQGFATVYSGDYLPLNYVGKAGETKTESGLVAWTKE